MANRMRGMVVLVPPGMIEMIPTELHAEHALELAEDLGVRDRAPRLVVLEHGRLLVDLLRDVLLRELLLHARRLHGLRCGAAPAGSSQ